MTWTPITESRPPLDIKVYYTNQFNYDGMVKRWVTLEGAGQSVPRFAIAWMPAENAPEPWRGEGHD